MNHTGNGVVSTAARSLDGEWRLTQGGRTRTVVVPHDWAIEGPFDREGACDTAKLPYRGRGIYERTFQLRADERALLAAGGEVYLEFDGAMANPSVEVNGKAAGGWDYGYMSFSLPIGQLIAAGDNELKVTCDTTKHSSRWYPGAGLYRSVRLKVVPRDHIVPGSVFITTPQIAANCATVRVDYALSASGPRRRSFTVANPVLWDVDHPHLYELDLEGETFRYGIRDCRFTADDGFRLNGRRLQLKGVCLHSDLGPLGMAFSRDAARRQLATMKDMGVNAIRTSHNPPAPEFLDLCDEMGFVVWDEAFHLYRAYWNRSAETAHLVPDHWNFPTNQRLPVFLYTSGDEAELFLNGQSLGRRKKVADVPHYPIDHDSLKDNENAASWDLNPYYAILPKYRLIWNDIAFAPGDLTAISYRGGKEVARTSLKTAGVPARVSLELDAYSDPVADLVFVRVALTDVDGIRIPDAQTRVEFCIEGAGEVVSVGNADPAGLDFFKNVASHPLFYGYAVVVVRRKGPGDIRLKACAPGLLPATFAF